MLKMVLSIILHVLATEVMSHCFLKSNHFKGLDQLKFDSRIMVIVDVYV